MVASPLFYDICIIIILVNKYLRVCNIYTFYIFPLMVYQNSLLFFKDFYQISLNNMLLYYWIIIPRVDDDMIYQLYLTPSQIIYSCNEIYVYIYIYGC